MQYYLRHYFNPDFDYLRPKPGIGEDGESSDLYSLGYVQNVIAGQLLAEVIPLEQAGAEPDPRFVLSRPVLPGGANTRVDPAYPNYLLSTSNGYVFYNNGKITVKRLLNVRQDVSFRTGNIFFVGDMAVHGSVRSGFSVQANNLRIMGMVEGGVARARRDLMVDGGARGGAGQHCLLDAGDKLLTPFLEKIEARARGNMVVEKYCLYSTVYAGANMVVREQVYGSTINAYGSVYVGRQLGNKAAISTKIYLGYDPLSIRQLEKIDKIISGLSQSITHLKAVAGHLPPDANEASRKLARLVEQRERIMKQRTELWSKLYLDENYMQNCRLMVPGKVYPGVEISVGRAFMLVERPYENVLFRLCYDDIIVEPLPPADKGKRK
ncbi:FapA family protein [uncultured Desulfovibrio sp.]|uniref:FapA family protein n=1 Tax=uncultured Desulfovibrio sp. TaxID=167968 RepID=UPI0026DD8BC4|nr:FapA family protein [uncultured Desulfovibrio sp.]